MMMFRTTLIIAGILALSCPVLDGQAGSNPADIQLEKLFTRLSLNRPDREKLDTNDSIIRFIDSYASSDTVFNHRFSKIRFLGQIISPDSLVKILNWNLILEGSGGYYYCYFILREKHSGPGKIIRLKAPARDLAPRTDTTYSSANWYGALYYDIRPFDFNGLRKYVLLGIDYGNPFITRKLIDVASFGENGEITFGLRCFTDGRNIQERILFEYSSKVVMSLKFESDRSIVFDHLSPARPEYREDRQFYGPDFSFDAFNYDRGLWRYKGDIDIKNK